MSKISKAKAKGNKAKLKNAKAKKHAKNYDKINDPRRYVPNKKGVIKKYKALPIKPSKLA